MTTERLNEDAPIVDEFVACNEMRKDIGPSASSPAGYEETGPGPSTSTTASSTTDTETTESSTPAPGPSASSPAGSDVSVALNESQNVSMSELMPVVRRQQRSAAAEMLNAVCRRLLLQSVCCRCAS